MVGELIVIYKGSDFSVRGGFLLFCLSISDAIQTAQNNPAADADLDLGDRRPRRGVLTFDDGPTPGVTEWIRHARQVRCQSDVFRLGQRTSRCTPISTAASSTLDTA